MLESPPQHQQQLWVIQRLQRICRTFRDAASGEPCLEQYEQQVRLMTGEDTTSAAAAWIEIIVQSLRSGSQFQPDEYMGVRYSTS